MAVRIGELLRERGWVDPGALDRAIAEQRHTGLRLVSLLVQRGLLGLDEAARALGQQLGVAAAMQRHLDGRDRKLANAIPPELARSLVALPIGRGRQGELVVVARDPKPAVKTALAAAAKGAVILSVTPASALEALVLETYGPADDEFDVDLSTGPIEVIHDPLPPRPLQPVPTLSAVGIKLPDRLSDDAIDIGAFNLVDLDDVHVSKDPNQSGQFPLPRAMPPLSPPLAAEGTRPPGPAIKVAAHPTLDDTLVKLQKAATRDDATDIAMAFATGRWRASLLVTIKEGMALGHRGHGGLLTTDAIQAVTMPLGSLSIVRTAHDAKKLVATVPTGAVQDRLTKLLGGPTHQAAAAVMVGLRVACVLVVGDPRDPAQAASANDDLDDLCVALGLAYARILREAKRS